MSYSKRAWCEPEAEWPVISLDDGNVAGASGLELHRVPDEPQEPTEKEREANGQYTLAPDCWTPEAA